ncbi:MAG: plasma-membrane proton-efflux P-type ATPase [Thaumarchaeota archaeon]|nr:plasma-membrane proton-efflux P-type ATPase [Nitrososphaerota archaeon]
MSPQPPTPPSADESGKAPIEDLFKAFSTGEDGISPSEARQRLEKYGYNEMEERKTNPLRKFAGYFFGPIPFMIEAAALLSVLISHWDDFVVIIVLLLTNAVVAFLQERKADNAIELLKGRLARMARVLRGGRWNTVAARELVPGDVVRIRLGDIVPADVKLFQGEPLQIDESALTGESLPVEKHASDIAYSGSVVQRGEMNALTISTGMRTYFGKTARLVEEARTKSHFQKALLKIGNYLIVTALVLISVVFVVALFRHESLPETLQFALVLLIASIPAALPAVLSVTMAVGATILAKKQALVSKLSAIEEMAGVDILCADKTGTLTKNEIRVSEVISFGRYTEADVMLYASLASREEDRDAIDTAIISRSRELNVATGAALFKTVAFKPFDPVAKRSEAAIKDASGLEFRVSKGAPQMILSLILDGNKVAQSLDTAVKRLASKGFRAIAVARTDGAGRWEVVGIVSLYDPPREDSKETISVARSLGINVKMLTGDHIEIAKEISRELGLGTNIHDSTILLDKNDAEVQKEIEEVDGFAQVFPEHKFRIVGLLQEREHIVGMTGDGVNDAPALKKADVGIAVYGATDVAKSAAHIVLTQPGISVIIDAIMESRRIFQRMINYATYRISETIRILIFLVASIILFNLYPITPLMIVILAILNDIPIMTIAYDNVRISNSPERWDMRKVIGLATALGLIGVISTFGLLYLGLKVFDFGTGQLQSLIFLKLSVAGHMLFFVTRTRGHFWTVKPSLRLFIAIVATKVIATVITAQGILMSPIGWYNAMFVWGYAAVWFVMTDLAKGPIYRLLERGNTSPAVRQPL